MSIPQSIQQEITSRYTFSPNKPLQQRSGFWVYDANHIDLKIPMTLKLIQSPSNDIARYLRKLK